MLVSSFNFSQSFNYMPYLFYRDQFVLYMDPDVCSLIMSALFILLTSFVQSWVSWCTRSPTWSEWRAPSPTPSSTPSSTRISPRSSGSFSSSIFRLVFQFFLLAWQGGIVFKPYVNLHIPNKTHSFLYDICLTFALGYNSENLHSFSFVSLEY